MMGQMAQNSSNMAAMDSYAKMMTKSSELAGNWGANINARDMPEWAKPEVAANI